MMKALIHKGKVVQVEDKDFPVHEDLKWIDITGVSPQPEPGWSYDGQVFTPPVVIPEPTADERKENYLNNLDPLIEAIEDKFPMAKGAFRQMVKDRMP